MRYLTALFFCLLSGEAFGQAAVQQYGTVVPYDIPRWARDHQIEDAGGIDGKNGQGVNPFSILDKSGPGLCLNTDLTTKPSYYQLCLGHDSGGNAVISMDSKGSAPDKNLQFLINGTTYTFPGTGSGNVVGPSPTVIGDLACWNNTTGSLLKGNCHGSGQFSGLFGQTDLTTGNAEARNSLTGEVTNASPVNSNLLPTGVTGGGRVTTSGNAVFGMFGYARCEQPGGGTCVAMEVTASNKTGNNPDLTLPPNASIGTNTTVPKGLNVTCGAGQGEVKDCSIGIHITNDASNPSSPTFNTAEYIQYYRQFGLYIDAMPAGAQTGAVIVNNGAGINLVLKTSLGMQAFNAVLNVIDSVGTSHMSVRQNGDVFIHSLGFQNHDAPPTISTCGSGSTLVNYSSDAKGTVFVGTGAGLTCRVNFGTAFLAPPVVVISGENNANIAITAKNTAGFTVGGSTLDGTQFDYIVMSNGG